MTISRNRRVVIEDRKLIVRGILKSCKILTGNLSKDRTLTTVASVAGKSSGSSEFVMIRE